jgi:hypothetical protein
MSLECVHCHVHFIAFALIYLGVIYIYFICSAFEHVLLDAASCFACQHR